MDRKLRLVKAKLSKLAADEEEALNSVGNKFPLFSDLLCYLRIKLIIPDKNVCACSELCSQ